MCYCFLRLNVTTPWKAAFSSNVEPPIYNVKRKIASSGTSHGVSSVSIHFWPKTVPALFPEVKQKQNTSDPKQFRNCFSFRWRDPMGGLEQVINHMVLWGLSFGIFTFLFKSHIC